ncbi:MAG: nitrous oxide-stimulated promoter family protein [Eubacteriales bacterium]|nr:nitrous oxide-stimulated promoter family protein [Eubacteriales bacterium]
MREKDVEKKRRKEQRVVEEMIRLYCRKNHSDHSGTGQLCPDCRALSDYARERSEKCPFMEQKTFCANCRVHCYKPEMREKIRTVMRFSGPRMLLYHPGMALWHLICSKREGRTGDKRA